MKLVPAVNGTPLLRLEDASGPLLQLVVAPVASSLQEVVLVPTIESSIIRQYGPPPLCSENAGDPFMLLPLDQFDDQKPPEGDVDHLYANNDAWPEEFPAARVVGVAQSSPGVGSSLGPSPVIGYAPSVECRSADDGGPRLVFDIGEPSSTSVVPVSGDGLEFQVFEGDAKAAHISLVAFRTGFV